MTDVLCEVENGCRENKRIVYYLDFSERLRLKDFSVVKFMKQKSTSGLSFVLINTLIIPTKDRKWFVPVKNLTKIFATLASLERFA